MHYSAFTSTSYLHRNAKVNNPFSQKREISPKMINPIHGVYDGSFNVIENNSVLISSAEVGQAQVDTNALAAFSLIFVTYSILLSRINGISKAADRRVQALENLRAVKSAQLSLSAFDSKDDGEAKTNNEQADAKVSEAIADYKIALEEEEKARTVLPGIRIRAPDRPDLNDDNLAAAKRFLDVDLAEVYDDNYKVDVTEKKRKVAAQDNEENKLSTGKIFVIGFIIMVQLSLLYMLSFDPMSSSIAL